MVITNKPNAISTAISQYERRTNLHFTPDESFYKRVEINRFRFWQLARGEKSLYGFEARNLAEFFGIAITDLI